jgi:ABC-2 type transport system permease protein
VVKKSEKTNQTNDIKKQSITRLFLFLLIIFAANFISKFAYKRLDLTTEKRYTLSPSTKEILNNLEDIVFVKVYLEGEFPAGFRNLRNATKEMLDEFRAVAKDKIQYQFINPSEDEDPKEREKIYRNLSKQGLTYTNLEVRDGEGKTEKIIFPGAIFSYRTEDKPLQLLKSQFGADPEVMLNNSVQQLEYEMASTIRKLTNKDKKKIGFLKGYGTLEKEHLQDIKSELSEFYQVTDVEINEKIKALNDFEALIIAAPDSAFSPKDKYIIDQFIMKGGKTMFLINGVNANMDSLSSKPVTMALSNDVKLDDQLFRYGIRINQNLVMDIQSAPIPVVVGYTGNQPQQKLFPWFYFPLITPTSNHPIVKNLNAVRLEFVSTVDTVESAPKIKKTPLLQSSQYTKVMNAPVRVSINSLREEPNMMQFNKPYQIVAYLLEGEFNSAFVNRLPLSFIENDDIGFKEKSKETKMIVVGTGSITRNDIRKSTGEYFVLGYDKYTREVFGNKNFMLNAVNYLCDDSGLLESRTREIKLRLLDKNKLSKERQKWQVINVSFPIILVIIFGLSQAYIRKKKYAA